MSDQKITVYLRSTAAPVEVVAPIKTSRVPIGDDGVLQVLVWRPEIVNGRATEVSVRVLTFAAGAWSHVDTEVLS
jgi:hypothetical protein